MKLGIGIDTGGTYTDAVIYDFEQMKVIAKNKALTTKENLEVGIGNALDSLPIELLQKAKILSLSTTLATNACVENKGGRAKLVLIGTTYKILDWIDAKSTYGFQNEDVLCIDNKTSFNGLVVNHPDWESIISSSDEWLSDAQALAVSEVNAMRNCASCEKLAKEKLLEKYNVPFIMATEIANELNFMERGATAMLNARLLPVINDFMSAVNYAIKKRNLDVKQMIVRSDGSLMSENMARSFPVQTILSGPASSIIGARGLEDCQNSIIVDMGGTTTDVSIVENSVPAMTDGIRIGGYKTQIKGVFIDTFGLGGDSRIFIEDGKPTLHARRVVPLCVAAVTYPKIVDDLKALLKSSKVSKAPVYEFLYLVKNPASDSDYTKEELSIISKLQAGAVMLGSGEISMYGLKSERLESEGIIMRCGLTPTDIMHVKGDFQKHDKTASLLAIQYLMKALPDYKNTPDDIQRFCDDIYELVCLKLYTNIVRIMLTNKYPKIFEKGVDKQMMDIIVQSFEDSTDKNFFDFNFSSEAILVGIGAPTHIFLPRVAKVLGTECHIPQHAEVANALGAIIADISSSAKIVIATMQPSSGLEGYTVYSESGNKLFEDKDEAIEFAKKIALEMATEDARKRGALGELSMDFIVEEESAFSKEGVTIDLGVTITANVTGHHLA